MHYVFGDYTLDTRRCELQRAGIPIPLRPKMFHLLTYLLAHRDRVVPKQELCEHLWPRQFISDATLDACLAQARRAVGDNGRTQCVLQTRHGYGYRFVAAVQVLDDPSPPSHESARMEAAHAQASIGVDPTLVPETLREPPASVRPIHPPPLHALTGERKVVTALVCTLANAATWAQHLEDEALYHRMQAFFAPVLEVVER